MLIKAVELLIKRYINICNIYIINIKYIIHTKIFILSIRYIFSQSLLVKILLQESLSSAAKLTKNGDPSKYKYFGYGTGFDARGSFLLSDSSGVVKNVVIFGDNLCFSVYIDNQKIY